MSLTEILLSNDSDLDCSCKAANEIAHICDLHLTPEQILYAHEKILNSSIFGQITIRNSIIIPLLNSVLNTNVNMYIAIILKLQKDDLASFPCLRSDYKLLDLFPFVKSFLLFAQNSPIAQKIMDDYETLIDYYEFTTNDYNSIEIRRIVDHYKALLDYYEFDVSNLEISNEVKQQIQDYRHDKYLGKLTKAAKYA